jgi:hypothetical protein
MLREFSDDEIDNTILSSPCAVRSIRAEWRIKSMRHGLHGQVFYIVILLWCAAEGSICSGDIWHKCCTVLLAVAESISNGRSSHQLRNPTSSQPKNLIRNSFKNGSLAFQGVEFCRLVEITAPLTRAGIAYGRGIPEFNKERTTIVRYIVHTPENLRVLGRF